MVFLRHSMVRPGETSIIRDIGNLRFDGIENRIWIEDGILHSQVVTDEATVVDSKYIAASRAQTTLLNPTGEMPIVSPLIKTVTPTLKAVASMAAMFKDPQVSAIGFWIDKHNPKKTMKEEMDERFDILNICMSNPFLPVKVFSTKKEAIDWVQQFRPAHISIPNLCPRSYITPEGWLTFDRTVKFAVTPTLVEQILRQTIEIESRHPNKILSRLYFSAGMTSISPGALLGKWDTSLMKRLRTGPIAIVTGFGAMDMSLYFLGKFFGNRNLKFFKNESSAREWLEFLDISTGERDDELIPVNSTDPSS